MCTLEVNNMPSSFAKRHWFGLLTKVPAVFFVAVEHSDISHIMVNYNIVNGVLDTAGSDTAELYSVCLPCATV